MAGKAHLDTWQAEEIVKHYTRVFIAPDEQLFTSDELPSLTPEQFAERIKARAHAEYEAKEKVLGSDIMRELERVVLLKTVDQKWMDHIDAMHELRRGIGLNAYAQQDPVTEYKRQGFDMFEAMIDEVREDTARIIFLAQIRGEGPKREKVAKESAAIGAGDGTVKQQPVRKGKKPGRNDPCPCGSGLKYKKCCGRNE